MPGPLDASAQHAMTSGPPTAAVRRAPASDAAAPDVSVLDAPATEPPAADAPAVAASDPGSAEGSAAPPRGRARARAGKAAALVAMVIAIAIGALSWRLPHQTDFFDFRIYWAATHAWLHGTPLYSFEQPGTAHLGFTYPPFAGLVLAPFSLAPVEVAEWLLFGISIAVLVAVAAGIGTAMARALRLPRAPTIVTVLALSLSIEPVRESLGFGQINIILLGLMVLDMWLINRRSMYTGIATGLAAALKLTPAVLVLVMLVRGHRASAARAVAAFLGASVLALAFAPTASRQYWTDKVWDSNRVGVAKRYANQSVAGVIARLQQQSRPSTVLWLLGVVVVVAALIVIVRRQQGPLADVRALIIGAAGATAISPISWTHHYVWAVPALALVVYDAIRLRSRWQWALIGLAYVAFAIGPVFVNRYLKAFPRGLVHQLQSVQYLAATAILCGLIAWVGIRSRDQAIGDDAPASGSDERRDAAPQGPGEAHAAGRTG